MSFKKLIELQKTLPPMSKDGRNPFTKSNYATLNEVLSKAKPILNKLDLFLEQSINDNKVSSSIRDLDGNILISSTLSIPESNDMQKIGSSITYARRYTLKSLLAIDDEDDDGNQASQAKEGLYKIKVLKDLKGKDLGQLSDKEIGILKSQLTYWSAKKDEGEEIKGALAQDLNEAYKFLQS